jgi:hypothetical protein
VIGETVAVGAVAAGPHLVPKAQALRKPNQPWRTAFPEFPVMQLAGFVSPCWTSPIRSDKVYG